MCKLARTFCNVGIQTHMWILCLLLLFFSVRIAHTHTGTHKQTKTKVSQTPRTCALMHIRPVLVDQPDQPPCFFGLHYYLTAVNKQFMPLNLGNTLHPDTRWSNHLDFLSLSASSYGKENSWRWSTDNTEAHYLLRALQGSFET